MVEKDIKTQEFNLLPVLLGYGCDKGQKKKGVEDLLKPEFIVYCIFILFYTEI